MGHGTTLMQLTHVFSRFQEVYPVKDLSTVSLIEKFKDYFSRYGFPDSLLTDRGNQFESSVSQVFKMF